MTSSQTLPTNSIAVSPKMHGLPDIALCGKAGAGKSTASALLSEVGYCIRSFGGPLKDVAVRIWGESGRTDRDKLQRLGVAVRKIDPDAWANLLIKNRTDDPSSPCVVDDLRFPNEYWALKGEGFVVVRITAPLSLRIDRLKQNGKWQDEAQLDHESETASEEFNADYEIENDGNTTDLYDELLAVVLKERKRR